MLVKQASRKLGHTPSSTAAYTASSPRSDLLHPWRYITGALGNGRMIGHVKRTISRLLYEYLGRRYPQTEWTTMNYGYAVTDQPFPAIAIDNPERFALESVWKFTLRPKSERKRPDPGARSSRIPCDPAMEGNAEQGACSRATPRTEFSDTLLQLYWYVATLGPRVIAMLTEPCWRLAVDAEVELLLLPVRCNRQHSSG